MLPFQVSILGSALAPGLDRGQRPSRSRQAGHAGLWPSQGVKPGDRRGSVQSRVSSVFTASSGRTVRRQEAAWDNMITQGKLNEGHDQTRFVLF